MADRIEYTVTEQPEPVARVFRLRVHRIDNDNWAGRDATDADLRAAGYVPASDIDSLRAQLASMTERASALEKERDKYLEALEDASPFGAPFNGVVEGRAMYGFVSCHGALKVTEHDGVREVEHLTFDEDTQSYEPACVIGRLVNGDEECAIGEAEELQADLRSTLEQTRERMRGYQRLTRNLLATAVRANSTVTSVNTIELDALENHWRKDALPASQPTTPEQPAAQPPEQGASDGRLHPDDPLAMALEAFDAVDAVDPSTSDLMVVVARMLEHLKQQRPSPPAPSPAVEGPSVRSPLPWALDNSAEGDVVDSAGALVSECQEPDDARFIVALANAWHAAQGKGEANG